MKREQPHGSLLDRLLRGTRWDWRSPAHEADLPADLAARVMHLETSDRFHAKQGRSTARVRFDSGTGIPLTAYLKRHVRLPLADRLLALVHPSGHHSPGGAEWRHLELARSIGLRVPVPLAVGEQIGPWGGLTGYLLVAELSGKNELHLVVPDWQSGLPRELFERAKREVTRELARLVGRMHKCRLYHKDLYLCHIFVNPELSERVDERLWIIDLHRLARVPFFAGYARWKDLGQLLYSTYGVKGIENRDRLRFWMHYRRAVRLRAPRLERWLIRFRAWRYLSKSQGRS